MIRAVQLVFRPVQTWERIVDSRVGAWRALFLSLFPLMLLASAAEAYSLTTWGKSVGRFGHYWTPAGATALRYEAARIGANLLALFFSALLLFLAARGFNFRRSFGQCALTLTYGFCALAFGWFLDAVPVLDGWIGWGLGVALAVSILYHGVALVLKPDLTKGLGLYLITLMVFVGSSGLAQFAAQLFLTQEKNRL